VFLIFAAVVLSTLLLLPFLRAPIRAQAKTEPDEPMLTVVTRAFRDPTYTLIFIGFFSCGYQLGFITAHFPAFITEVCGPIDPTGMLAGLGIATTSALGAVAIAVIGIANIGGSVLAGWMGGHFPKKYLLASIYTGRTIASAIFILMPMTPTTVLVYSVAMGAMWLATVPLTSGLVAHIYGVRYMGTLYGFIFLSHQIGSFIGIWLGGKFYDLDGTYDTVWWIGVGVGAFSAIIHLPIRERPLVALPA
jgi:MFS family permease